MNEYGGGGGGGARVTLKCDSLHQILRRGGEAPRKIFFGLMNN